MKNILKKNSVIINFSWHISSEIKEYLKKMDIRNKIINIIEIKDFVKK